MLTTNQAEFLIAVFIAWWWAGALYSATSHKSWKQGASCFPLAVLTVYYFLLAFEVAGFRDNTELRTTIFRWMLGFVAVSEGTVKLSPLLAALWILLRSHSLSWSVFRRWRH
jgi:hypothetical protein